MMAICFAVNHGCVTTPTVYATSVLGGQVGYVGNGLLYAATMVSSLLLGPAAVELIGLLGGLLVSMLFYCVYLTLFAAAAWCAEQGGGLPTAQWYLFCSGSVAAGLAAGVLWTAQGGYFGRTASLLARAEDKQRGDLSASLAGDFAFWYLLFEVASKLAIGLLQSLGFKTWTVSVAYLILAAGAMILMSGRLNLSADVCDGQTPRSAGSRSVGNLTAVVGLWGDPKIWLLAPLNLTFGFSAAYMNGSVNQNIAAKELGTWSVGYLTALTAVTAALLSQVFGRFSALSSKGAPICLGALSFLSIPVFILALNCCDQWRWWISILYLAQGCGRAVYESTTRAVFTDFFSGNRSEGAFANAMLQTSFAFSICFFLSSTLKGKFLAYVVCALATAMPLMYGFASWLKVRGERRETSLLARRESGRRV